MTDEDAARLKAAQGEIEPEDADALGPDDSTQPDEDDAE